VRRGTRGLLSGQRGWKVVGEAVDGGEAVEQAKRLKPDLAVLDITMPNLDGLEATRQIREVAPNTKVLVLTMHESVQMVRRVLEAGAQGYVLKSDLAAHLVKAIDEVSQGKISLTPKVSEIVLQGFRTAEREPRRTERAEVRPTPRELQVIRLLAEGKANKEVSSALGIKVRTVETHRAKIMLKLGLHSLAELIHYAIRNDLISKQTP
jgi:DNA-binding NarL/FixJ family response regulator